MDYIQIAAAFIEDRYPQLCYKKPRLMDLPPGTILGTWAYSVPGTMRFILAPELELAPGVLPGDLARAWIRDQYKLPLRRRKDQLGKSYEMPLHARVGIYGDCVYIDLVKAYVQILALGWDVEYVRGQYISSDPRPVPPEIQSCKQSYAIAVSMTSNARSDFEVMGKDGVFARHPLNIFSNPCLFNLAHDTMNGIAAEIKQVLGDNLVYCNTDGYIVKMGYERICFDIIRSWGFKADIKAKNGVRLEGATQVWGVGAYKVGEYETRRHDPDAVDYTNEMMSSDEISWLKLRWSKWNERLSRER